MPSIKHRGRAAVIVLGALALTGCDKSFFAEPARGPAGVAVSFSVAADNAAAFDKVTSVNVIASLTRVEGNGSTGFGPLVLNTTVPFQPAAESRVIVGIDAPEGSHEGMVGIFLKVNNDTIFFDYETATIEEGETTQIEFDNLTPFVTTITMPATVRTLTFIGDTVTIGAVPRYATGDIMTGPSCGYFSASPNVASVNQTTGRVVATGPGTAQIQFSCNSGRSAQVTVTVTIPSIPGSRLYGNVRDLQTLADLNATLVLTNLQTGQQMTATGSTFEFTNLAPGTYSLHSSAAGHSSNVANNVVVSASQPLQRLDFDLPATTFAQPVGGVTGLVRAENGQPLAGANVLISGGQQTNGAFRSVVTASDGTFTLPGITLTDASGVPIQSFTIVAAGAGFKSISNPVTLTAGTTTAGMQFTLALGTASTVFSEGFESGSSEWISSGMWNRTTGAGIRNLATPTFVTLAPDDNSDGNLPTATEGSFYMWYGGVATGSFIGQQTESDGPKSGGTSQSSNTGLLTSPVITLPATMPAASLNFSTWFEIESVNPNQSGYDLMTIEVLDIGTNQSTVLRTLNPFVDPELDQRNDKPFTSAGFNRAPVYRSVAIDLSAFRGRQIRISFRFNTVDGQFNGFRGWIVDAIRISDEVALGSNVVSGAAPKIARPTRGR